MLDSRWRASNNPQAWLSGLVTAPRRMLFGQPEAALIVGQAPGQAPGLRRPPRPPSCAFSRLQWVFDRARVLQDPL